ncbi:MAG: YeeE/YedE family protein [Leptospiraceae bacterium]|nr:YeeE/YedE family protein [Leptospiraceae bacterium]MCB1314754.1 YeeE/YedE family protein [Leptospiraceae bacterium]MCB1320226.1 YeeE/YedE family protein [Leptospiraceae bacterium]
MAMIAPMDKLAFFGREIGIVIAMLLGFGFGFFLERAGFGSARKLCANWYGRDFAVIRVMFTAVLVCMIGLFGLHYAGLLYLDLVYINPTYIWPQLVGALLLGIGFAVGGYCPGTTAVAISTGKLDGLSFLFGFLGGVFVFTEGYSFIESFYTSGAMGRVFLADVLHVPHGVLVFIITVFAVGAFVLLRYIQNRVNGVKGKVAAGGK